MVKIWHEIQWGPINPDGGSTTSTPFIFIYKATNSNYRYQDKNQYVLYKSIYFLVYWVN